MSKNFKTQAIMYTYIVETNLKRAGYVKMTVNRDEITKKDRPMQCNPEK